VLRHDVTSLVLKLSLNIFSDAGCLVNGGIQIKVGVLKPGATKSTVRGMRGGDSFLTCFGSNAYKRKISHRSDS